MTRMLLGRDDQTSISKSFHLLHFSIELIADKILADARSAHEMSKYTLISDFILNTGQKHVASFNDLLYNNHPKWGHQNIVPRVSNYWQIRPYFLNLSSSDFPNIFLVWIKVILTGCLSNDGVVTEMFSYFL